MYYGGCDGVLGAMVMVCRGIPDEWVLFPGVCDGRCVVGGLLTGLVVVRWDLFYMGLWICIGLWICMGLCIWFCIGLWICIWWACAGLWNLSGLGDAYRVRQEEKDGNDDRGRMKNENLISG